MKKLEDTDFFDKSELRRAGRRAKNTDSYIPKKRHFFAKFLLVLLIFIIAGGCVYYFVIDTPKIFYTKIADKASNISKLANSKEFNNLNYTIDASIESNDKETKQIFDVINKIELNGTYKLDNKKLFGSNNIKYKNEDLIDFNYLIDTSSNIAYLKLDKVLDKTLKLDLNTEEDKETTYSTNKEDYIKVYTSYMKHLSEALENAKYERKITKLDKNIVFKEILEVDENVAKDLYTKLIHDDDFLRAIAKIEGTSVSEISDKLNEEISDLEAEVSTISIYKIPITNEVLKIEIEDEKDNYIITKEKDTYNYQIKTNKGAEYKGYLKINKIKDETKLTFSYEDIKEELKIGFDFTYSKNVYKLDSVDTEKAVEFDDLKEEDITKITEFVTKNKTLNTLLDDIGLDDPLSENALSM